MQRMEEKGSNDIPQGTASEKAEQRDECKNRTASTSETPEETEKLASRLLKCPTLPEYMNMPSPVIRKEPPATEPVWEDDTEPIVGFTEFRKYKKMNETRVITPYKSKETAEEKVSKPKGTSTEVKIDDPERFFLEKFDRIPITNLQSLLNMVNRCPGIGYLTMTREHMDLVNDYDPYNYTICNYNSIDKSNYVTISPNGLLEFYKGDADFLPTDRLQLEYKLFSALKEIPSFRTMRLWKAFMVWLKRGRCRRFIEAKDKLEMFFAAKYNSGAVM